MINIGGRSKGGLTIGSYGSSENNKDDKNRLAGWIEPESKKWIIWFTQKGDLQIYTERKPDGGVIGKAWSLKGR